MKGDQSKYCTRKTDSKLKRKSAGANKKGKAAKDPNKPKRPASAFFVFMEDFRKQFKIDHLKNKSVAAVGRAGGHKWKSMSEAEKAPFVAKAEKRKTEYNKNMLACKKKIAAGGNEDEYESDRSKSEVNDDDNEENGSGEVEEDDE